MVLRGMARWPEVPAVFGWLGLDRRGRWRLRGETVGNRAACEFMARNYAADAHGRWFFQNGPQRVFVALEAAPLVFGLQPDGRLRAHTGAETLEASRILLTDTGQIYLRTGLGPGLLAAADLVLIAERFCAADGMPLADLIIEAALAGNSPAPVLHLRLGQRPQAVERAMEDQIPALLGFVREPAPNASDAATSGP